MAERTPVQFIDGPGDSDGFNDPLDNVANVGGNTDDRNNEQPGIVESISGDVEQPSGNNGGLEEYKVFSPFDVGIGGTPTRSDGNNTTGPRRRGRPLGSRNRPAFTADGTTAQPVATRKVQADLGDIVESLLLSVHLMGANLLEMPSLALEKDEAKQMAVAIREVQKHYPSVAIDPKKMALMNLATVVGGIYIGRGIDLWKRTPKRAKVLPMPQPTASKPVVVETPPAPKPSEMAPSDLWQEEMSLHVVEGS